MLEADRQGYYSTKEGEESLEKIRQLPSAPPGLLRKFGIQPFDESRFFEERIREREFEQRDRERRLFECRKKWEQQDDEEVKPNKRNKRDYYKGNQRNHEKYRNNRQRDNQWRNQREDDDW